MKKVIVFLANGFEEVEALTAVDLLRRAGAEVTMLSLDENKAVTSSGGTTVMADATAGEENLETADLLVLPGGLPGTLHLARSPLVQAALTKHNAKGGLIGAICAAPALVLGEGGYLKDKEATCYPGMERHLLGAVQTEKAVTEAGNILTSRGVGTAIPFALRLIARLYGEEKATEIAQSIVFSA